MKYKKEKYSSYKEIKNIKLKNKILKRIEIIQNRIKKDIDVSKNFILKDKLRKLKIVLNSMSMSAKERNRYKEIKRINLRIIAFKKELGFLDNHVNGDHNEIIRITRKIQKLISRRNVLEGSEFSKKIYRRAPSLIRYDLRKYRIIEETII